MLFNSIDFAVFFPIVFAIYWLMKSDLKLQNLFILLSSYFFYAYWDPRFLSLIVISTLSDYLIANRISNRTKSRKALLILSISINLGILLFFKYFNFFTESFGAVFTLFGSSLKSSTLNIILPVGISFYTFQTMAYTIDVYRGNVKATKNLVNFACFVAFFPQLVAGPIERASDLLPQFSRKRSFKYENGKNAAKQIAWGFFKKIVLADSCAELSDMIFESPESFSGSSLFIGSVLFALQIYGDFSGYSDIAIGCARLLGFNLRQNFAYPYFASNPIEFWQRWHISLTGWFRDYVYIPLGGNRGNNAQHVRNILIVFMLSGLWHGAGLNFIAWGFLHGLVYLCYYHLMRNFRTTSVPIIETVRKTISALLNFTLVCLLWIFFRNPDLNSAVKYLGNIFVKGLFSRPEIMDKGMFYIVVAAALITFIIEFTGRREACALQACTDRIYFRIRGLVYLTLVFILMLFWGADKSFIYFQF